MLGKFTPAGVVLAFVAGSLANQNVLADRVAELAPGPNGFELFVVRVTVGVTMLLHLFLSGVLVALVVTGARLLLSKNLSTYDVTASIAEAHLPLVAWTIWTAWLLYDSPPASLDAIHPMVERLGYFRLLAYAAGVLLLAQRLAARCNLSGDEAWAAALPPVCVIVCAMWSTDSLLALLPS
jgi:hypothetical protein